MISLNLPLSKTRHFAIKKLTSILDRKKNKLGSQYLSLSNHIYYINLNNNHLLLMYNTTENTTILSTYNVEYDETDTIFYLKFTNDGGSSYSDVPTTYGDGGITSLNDIHSVIFNRIDNDPKLNDITTELTTGKVAVVNAEGLLKKSDKTYDNINNVLDLTEYSDANNKIAIVNSGNTLKRSSLDYGNIMTIFGNQIITGSNTFSSGNIFFSGLDTSSHRPHHIAGLDLNNGRLLKSDLTFDDIVRIDDNQTINGVKTFGELKLAYSCSTYTDANRNLVAFGNGNDFLLKSVYKINDFLRLADTQTITGQKTYTHANIYFTNLNSGSAGTDKILVLGGDNSIRQHTTTIANCLNSNIDFSNYATLNSNQTITGQKTFSNENAIHFTNLHSSASHHPIACVSSSSGLLYRHNSITSDKLVLTDITQTITGRKTFQNITNFGEKLYNNGMGRSNFQNGYIVLWYEPDGHIYAHDSIALDKLVSTNATQTITATKTFSGTVNLTSQNTYLTNAHTTSTGTHPIACIGATDGRISKTSITQGNVCTTNTTQTISGTKTFSGELHVNSSTYTGTDRHLCVYGLGNERILKSSYKISDLVNSGGTWHTNLISDTCDSIMLSDYNSSTFFVIRLGKIYFFRRSVVNSSLSLYHSSINQYDYNTSKIIMYYQRNPTDAFYPYIGGAIEYGSSRIRLFDGGNITYMDQPAVKSFAMDETGTKCWAITHSRVPIQFTKFTYPVSYSTKPGNLDEIDMSRDGHIIVGHNGTTVYYWHGSNWGSLGTFGNGSMKSVSVDNDGILYACDTGDNLYKYENNSWSFARNNCARVNYKNGVLAINTSSYNVEFMFAR